MQTISLFKLMTLINNYYRENKIEPLFNQFIGSLQQSLFQQGNQPVGPHKDNLFKALKSFNASALPFSQKRIYLLYKGNEIIGPDSVAYIEKILYDSKFDPNGVIQKITQHKDRVVQFNALANTLIVSLKPFSDQAIEILQEDEAILEITFAGDTNIKNIVNLADYADIWNKLFRAFGLLMKKHADDAKIISISKSSPVVIEIASVITVLFVISKAVDYILNRIDKYLTIRKKMEEIKNLKLKNKQIAKDLEIEANEYKNIASEEIAKTLIKEHGNTSTDGEVKNALSISLKELFEFLDKGGKVDVHFHAESKVENNEEKLKIEDIFQKIRILEDHIEEVRLLPYKSENAT